MDHDDVVALRQHSAAWRLLRADSAPLIISFLDDVFIAGGVRGIAAGELTERLDDVLYALNEGAEPPRYPRPARAYLDDWAGPQTGWLRKYYPAGSDEAHFDATPAAEKAVAWIAALRERSFVGTESRLNTVVELLRQMAYGAETDPEVRLAELERRRAEIDAEIERVRSGDAPVLDPSAQRDRYQQFAGTARELLADFREVEANFRALDRDLREQITTWDGAKGGLLEQVVAGRASIADSDQGRSFHAFYDFLLSPTRQEELTDLLRRVHELPALSGADPRLRGIHHDWLAAGERTQATVRTLSEQLRRYLDDRVWLENRRVMDVLRSIEAHALALRGEPVGLTFELDALAPTVVLPMERPLYSPPAKTTVDSAGLESGDDDFDAAALFGQAHVDPAPLTAHVRRALLQRPHVGLAALVREHPLEQGLTELITYFSLADDAFDVVFDEVPEQIRWDDDDGLVRQATVPRVTYARREEVP
jgi:flagellar motility protein MotE (MotC chaperone)